MRSGVEQAASVLSFSSSVLQPSSPVGRLVTTSPPVAWVSYWQGGFVSAQVSCPTLWPDSMPVAEKTCLVVLSLLTG